MFSLGLLACDTTALAVLEDIPKGPVKIVTGLEEPLSASCCQRIDDLPSLCALLDQITGCQILERGVDSPGRGYAALAYSNAFRQLLPVHRSLAQFPKYLE